MVKHLTQVILFKTDMLNASWDGSHNPIAHLCSHTCDIIFIIYNIYIYHSHFVTVSHMTLEIHKIHTDNHTSSIIMIWPEECYFKHENKNN